MHPYRDPQEFRAWTVPVPFNFGDFNTHTHTHIKASLCIVGGSLNTLPASSIHDLVWPVRDLDDVQAPRSASAGAVDNIYCLSHRACPGTVPASLLSLHTCLVLTRARPQLHNSHIFRAQSRVGVYICKSFPCLPGSSGSGPPRASPESGRAH